jgi:acetolactate synthase regulatory subunit
MTERRYFDVTVALRGRDSTRSLLSVASVLHRRSASVSQAQLAPAAQGRQVFRATFIATERQAATVRASLGNLVDVLEVVLGAAEALETPSLVQEVR